MAPEVTDIIRAVRQLSVPRAIVYGGLTVGTLDLIDAFAFFGLRSGAQPVAILHSIASGFIGREAARTGGASTAVLGFFTHFFVATCIVTVYVLASRLLPVLRTRWIVCGVAFGVVAYFFMTFVVVPLSHAGGGSISFALPPAPIMANGILIHMFGVGLPAAFFASRVR